MSLEMKILHSLQKVNTTRYGLSSVRYIGANLWNNLPTELKRCVDIKLFHSMLQTWEGPECKFGFCTLCKLKLRQFFYSMAHVSAYNYLLSSMCICIQTTFDSHYNAVIFPSSFHDWRSIACDRRFFILILTVYITTYVRKCQFLNRRMFNERLPGRNEGRYPRDSRRSIDAQFRVERRRKIIYMHEHYVYDHNCTISVQNLLPNITKLLQ